MGGTGDYTYITIVGTPVFAAPGETVNFRVRIFNETESGFYGFPYVMINETPVEGAVLWLAPYPAYLEWYFNFTMPNHDVAIAAESWCFIDGNWIKDAEDTEDVYLGPSEQGHISDKWVNKAPEGNRLQMPAEVVADGNTFEVGVSYVNDSGGSFIAGCAVTVTRPNGSTISPATDWAGMSPEEELSVEYNIAAVNQDGIWAILIRFLKQGGEELDRFEGTCLVAGVTAGFSEFGVAAFSKA